ncbi:hypothetical protein RND81_06G243300 [Saponaria officinalis]|uniref:Uncharacterized protein n=1 Tax=Saponaria officinalis TaxID=3572 RepID=A0AAW1KAX1_SAPOF
MGVDMELEFDKFCKVGRSPRTVLPAPRHQSKGENRNSKVKPSSRKADQELLNIEGFTELKFRNYRSVSCKNLLPSEDVELNCNESVRRGSVYESSRERNFIPETRGGRKKIEFSRGGESSFSFSILDSICGSDDELEDRSSKLSLHSDSISSGKPPRRPCSVDVRDRQSSGDIYAERDSMENEKFKCQEVSGPSNNANVLKERDFLALNKSLSAKLLMPHSPTHSEESNSKSSPKSRFTPIRKMFDPLTKSKSHRNPPNDAKSSSLNDLRAKTLRKSLLQDFSGALPPVEADNRSVSEGQAQVVSPCLAAHLQGSLKMEQRHGAPYFEFSVDQTEDVFVAKTWKAEDALNWVYTFHSVQGRKKSNASGRGMKYSNKDCPMVGQMQVKCYLCSELRGGSGVFTDSMMTEFVLYDIDHARKSVTSEEGIISPDISKVFGASPSSEVSTEGNVELDDLFSLSNPRLPMSTSIDRISTDFSSPYPLSMADLHPRLEIAAVVVQAPLGKRESLKYKRGDRHNNQVHPSLLDSYSIHEGRKGVREEDRVKVNVVAPLGNHSLPSSGESRGPTPLLDRWRLGGGCDCGGWDMACPLVVFGNPRTQFSVENSVLEKNQPLKLFVQGGKENVPALTITVTDKGEYTVDFHAQLSKLQAFAVCVSILHTSEASSLVEREKSKELLQCSSLKVLVEDEVKILIEAVTEEEKKKVAKPVDGNPPAFMINPPFSPIARV